jgi:hypothetical protein
MENDHGDGKRSQLNSRYRDSKRKRANNTVKLDFGAQSSNAATRASDLSCGQ